MNLALNPATGWLHLPSDCYLTPAIHPTELLTLSPTQPITSQDMRTGWVWHFLRFQQDTTYWQLNLGFEHAILRTCSFGLPTTKPLSSWDTWSEEHEKQQATRFEAWLTQQLGLARTFTWGSAWASYDPRSGASSIGLRYAAA